MASEIDCTNDKYFICAIYVERRYCFYFLFFFFWGTRKTLQSSKYKTRGSLELILKTLVDEHIQTQPKQKAKNRKTKTNQKYVRSSLFYYYYFSQGAKGENKWLKCSISWPKIEKTEQIRVPPKRKQDLNWPKSAGGLAAISLSAGYVSKQLTAERSERYERCERSKYPSIPIGNCPSHRSHGNDVKSAACKQLNNYNINFPRQVHKFCGA